MNTDTGNSIPVGKIVGPVTFDHALENLDSAVAALFDTDPAVRSVGITAHGHFGFGYRVVRNSRVIRPLSASTRPITQFNEIPVRVTDVPGDIQSLLRVPHAGPGSPATSTLVPETLRQRPVGPGLQIQNFDYDDREGHLSKGFMVIGTLGCLVRTSDGFPALISNNHVIAGENRGIRSDDRILQPGHSAFDPALQIAVLEDFVALEPSEPGAAPIKGTVTYNTVDAAIGRLIKGVPYSKGYLPTRAVGAPSGVAPAMYGDEVFKVGRTTGLTFGVVTDVATVVGPVLYGPGECWFRSSIVVEGLNGTLFSDHGDSGSAVLKRSTGEKIGLLYAGNGEQSYVCPMEEIMRAFSCSLM
jgi:hypothetical protein